MTTGIEPAAVRAIVVRETLVSMAINAAISAGFFFAVFGMGTRIAARGFGVDFLPQAFMVALMGSLVPAMLVRRHSGARIVVIVRRAVVIAAVSLAIAGGGALAIAMAMGDVTIDPLAALAIKVIFGALLAGTITPIAVRAALRQEQCA